MEQTLDLMLDNLADVGRGILAQVPLIAAGVIAGVLVIVLGRAVRGAIRRGLDRQDRVFADMIARLVYAGFIAFGIFVALWIAIPTVKFTELFASLGVTGIILGFALRDIIENFVAGILILWRRPFRVDDQIRAGAYEGTVVEINFRSTVLRTYDGIKVYVPNGKVFTEPIENLTGYPERRVTVVLGIDQNASVARARDTVLEALGGIEGVLHEPAPAVYFDAIGDFTNNLHVLFWTRPSTRVSELTTKSDVTERLYTALQEAGIGFPYPIRTVQVEGLPDRSPAAGDGRARATGWASS